MSFSAMATMAGSLPPNARYITHRNECYDWGTLGWLLTTKKVGAARQPSGGFAVYQSKMQTQFQEQYRQPCHGT